MHTADSASSLHDAERALKLRHASPVEARDLAVGVLRRPDLEPDARTIATWALGLACREMNELENAESHLLTAIDLAHAADDAKRVVAVKSGLVAVLAARGRPVEALSLADEIRSALGRQDRAELDMKRALALEAVGRVDEAVHAYSDALEVIASGPDRLLEARLRCNRGIVFAFQGDNDAALDDSLIAERIARAENQQLLAGGAANNAGFVHGRIGNIVEALDAFDRADELYAAVGYPGRCDGVLAADRCQVLLTAGLHDEARASAELAVSALEVVEDVIDLAEAQLLLARTCLAQGDHAAAVDAAHEAASNFHAAGRRGWATLADSLTITAQHALGDISSGQGRLTATELIADRLAEFGWVSESVAIRVTAAEMALDLGDRATAERQLRHASSARHRGSADRRANAWLATALLRRSKGDRAGTRRALTAGLNIVAEHQLSLGATDLRVGTARHAEALTHLGIELALEDHRAVELLRWTERQRASALAIPSARSSPDGRLATELAELRRLRAEIDADRSNGTAAGDEPVAIQEQRVRDAARLLSGSTHIAGIFDVRELRAELGERTLVEYVNHDGRLAAVTVTARRCRLHDLGPVASITPHLDAALFGLRRLARRGASTASMAAAHAAMDDGLTRLEELLVEPLALATDAVVIVPTGALHRVPWTGLPAMRRRDVTITPSASRWLASTDTQLASQSATVVAGPGLVHAGDEALAVAGIYADATVLIEADASVDNALSALEGAGVAHIACHGSLRADSPMFSALQMHDGPMTIYDLEQLAAPPNIVVLPACNAGAADVTSGDELIGTTAALLGIGVQTVIAPIIEVNDAAIVDLMTGLHRHLVDGITPAGALALVRQGTLEVGDPAQIGAALSLISSS